MKFFIFCNAIQKTKNVMHSGFITNQLEILQAFYSFNIADYGLQFKKTQISYL